MKLVVNFILFMGRWFC